MNQSVRVVAVNECGQRIGESHHRAKLTDHDVDLVRELHEDHGITYAQLAEKFGVSRSVIREICRYRIRSQIVARYKALKARVAKKTHNPEGDDYGRQA